MNRSKTLQISLRLANSLLLNHPSATTNRSLHTQVTHFTSPCLHSSLFNPPICCNTSTFIIPQMHWYRYVSTKVTKPGYLLELITTNDWSEELENELSKSELVQSHETVIYILKKLENDPEKTAYFFNWVSKKAGFKPSSCVYGVTLRNLGCHKSLRDFWVVVKRMTDEGYDLDKETYLSILGNMKGKTKTDKEAFTECYKKMAKKRELDLLVKGVVDVVVAEEWNDGVKKKLKEMNLGWSRNTCLRILSDLKKYPLKALKMFRWSEENLECRHDTVTYNAILRVLGQEGSIKEFWNMVKEMKGLGYNVDIHTYIKLSRKFQKHHMIKDMVELYELMMDSPYKPSLSECSQVLRKIANVDSPDMNLIYRVAKKYESTGHTLSKAVYDGIHRALTSMGRFDDADKILVTMRNAGFEPDNITFSQGVFGLCKVGRLEEACKALDKMESDGCIPDVMTWTILIEGHLKAGEVDKALVCLSKMIGKNVFVDSDLLEVMVSGLCSNKRFISAYNLVVELVRETRLIPWQATYKQLIQMLLEERKLKEVFNILHMMKNHNFPPFAEPCVEYISKNGTFEDIRELMRVISSKRYPSFTTCFFILQSFLKEGRYSEAQDLVNTFPHHIRTDPNIVRLFGSSKV